eukprot:IDg5351t1
MLLANSAVDSSQKIAVLAAAAPSNINEQATTTTSDYLQAVSYYSVASVLRQCDNSNLNES